MSNIAVQSHWDFITENNHLFRNINVINGQNTFEPWHDLKKNLEAKGHVIKTLDLFSDKEIDVLIYCDRPENIPRCDLLLERNDAVKILMLLECPSQVSSGWDMNYHQYFDFIFTWADDLVDGRRYIKSNFCTKMIERNNFEDLKINHAHRNLICMINSCIIPSIHRVGVNELYSLRLQFIQYMSINKKEYFDLFGNNWPPGFNGVYKGRSENKYSTYAGYKFSFCIENYYGYNGYVTEKILDVLVSGCIPVYLGAPNIEDLIPESCYIDLRRFSNLDNLLQYLESMSEADYFERLNAIRCFLKSRTNLYSSEKWVQGVSDVIDWSLKKKNKQSKGYFAQFCVDTNNYSLYQHKEQGDFSLLPDIDCSQESLSKPLEYPNSINRDEIIVLVGWDPNYKLYQECKRVWDLLSDSFPHIKVIFVCSTKDKRGENILIDNQMYIGCRSDFVTPSETYYKTGNWSISEQEHHVFRLVETLKFTIKKFPNVKHIWTSTITSILHLDAVYEISQLLPLKHLFAGYPGILREGIYKNAPIVHGATIILSRDTAELAVTRYQEFHSNTMIPNDHWLGLILCDIPRIPLPMFTFQDIVFEGYSFDKYYHIAKSLLNIGHYKFRVKTKSDSNQDMRIKTDPRIMARIADAMVDSCYTCEMAKSALEQTFNSINKGPRNIPFYDHELILSYRNQ